MDFSIWNKNWSKNEIWAKPACPDMPTFSQIQEKLTGLGIWNQFGMDLVIPSIWLYSHLGQKKVLWQAPRLGATAQKLGVHLVLCLIDATVHKM